jgi:uncharacterized PurR-regulated membrane protein YhhQ (DUF165 family)
VRGDGAAGESTGGSARVKSYRFYDLILGAYVCVLLCANLIGPAKVSTVHVPVIGAVTFMAGVLFFPISYIFGDILTEVYGYARDRRVVWSGFAALVFAAFMAWVIVRLPPADFWRANQPAVEAIFGNTPRIVCASIIAFWCGSASSARRCAASWSTRACSTASRSRDCGRGATSRRSRSRSMC